MPEQLIRLPEVRLAVGLSRSEIYRRIACGTFPRPVALGARAVAWVRTEIDQTVQKIIEARESTTAPRNALGKRLADAKLEKARSAQRPARRGKRQAANGGAHVARS